ncbi:unnamed protein product [Durusdinium trenchii]|uniref:UV excision repair protein RAD23 n=1 Tax=Durusdinium trenchii TaxID=1381693 RepID=A0ABP0LKZ0_9DINO
MSNGKFSGPRAAFEWGGRALQLGKQETFRLVCTELAPLVVQKKLKLKDTEIQLIASGGEKLRDEQTLGEARVSYSGSLTAEIVGQDKDPQKAPGEAILDDSAGSGFGEQPEQSESKDTEKSLKKVEEDLLSTIGPDGLLTRQRCVTILTTVGFTAQEAEALLKDYAPDHDEIGVQVFLDLLRAKTASLEAAPSTEHNEELLEDGEVVHSPSGITFLIPPAVTEQKIKPTAQLVTDLTSTDLQSLKNQLQPGEVVFQPVFRLSPEENQSD